DGRERARLGKVQILGRAQQQIELQRAVNDRGRRFNGAQKAKLHQHQEYGKCHTADPDRGARLVVQQVAPRQRRLHGASAAEGVSDVSGASEAASSWSADTWATGSVFLAKMVTSTGALTRLRAAVLLAGVSAICTSNTRRSVGSNGFKLRISAEATMAPTRSTVPSSGSCRAGVVTVTF